MVQLRENHRGAGLNSHHVSGKRPKANYSNNKREKKEKSLSLTNLTTTKILPVYRDCYNNDGKASTRTT